MPTLPFPRTSNLYWGIGSIVFLLWIGIGEGLWLGGVRNFTALTWFIRAVVPRPLLIGISIALAAFIVLHLGVARGYIAGPNR